jgi:predicted amidohydrolase YtcJ
VNGKIHTMDDANRVVNSVTIRDGRFVEVTKNSHGGHDATVIDLGGRTVVPGLIESHTHFVSLANRPGYHVAQWELASNVAEVLALLAARRKGVPNGQFITAMGAGTPRCSPNCACRRSPSSTRPCPTGRSFSIRAAAARRVPTRSQAVLRERDGTARRAVRRRSGWLARHRGRREHANHALSHLRIRQTFEDKKRSALDAMAFSASVGITAVLDQTLVAVANGTLDPATLDPQPTHALFNLNHYRMYDAWLALHAEDRTLIRLQINFLHNQGFIPELGDLAHQLPELPERLKNQFPFFGRRHSTHWRDRRVGRALRDAVESRQLRGLVRG